MAKGIRGPGAPPPTSPTLQQKEAARVKQQQRSGAASADAARLASQAGFQRLQRGARKGGLDIGDSTRAPIPLPNDDVDPDAWSPEQLEAAQDSLALASTQLDDASELSAGEVLGEALVRTSFFPTEADVATLQAFADDSVPVEADLGQASQHLTELFGMSLSDETPLGQRLLAAGLVVAGESTAVVSGDGGLDPGALAAGVQKVTQRSNQAVGEAQKMNKGISKELSVHRTFVFKR